ncbi:MAG: mandelate racemase/muconate lactonizing enzyme family protein, partial [Anaerolineae bacterium]|nr:mandelate racemase/muconate lactonizing enzyme family protein [Anaerolineae bacterium]
MVYIKEIVLSVSKQTPARRPLRDALQSLAGSGSVTVTLLLDTGIMGTGTVGFGRIRGAPDVLATLIDQELSPLVIGRDPADVRAIHAEMLRELEYHGAFGLAMFGVAAVDTALWDCWGKILGIPCHKLWGTVRASVPAYAMVGWLNYTDEEVVSICKKAQSQGFHAVKIKVGYPALEQDIHRVQVVQKALGPDVKLMVDANQTLTVAEAIRRGRVFHEMGCYWWEEPIPAQDLDGYTHLSQVLDIPVATGE